MVIIGQVVAPTERLTFTGNNVRFRMGQQLIGTGTVYISENSLVWKRSGAENDGISIFWKRIGVHGIANVPTKCIYFLIDRQIKWPGIPEILENGNGQSENGNEEDSDEEIFEDAEEDQLTECWLLPDDIHVVDSMYKSMIECQAMHPDTEDSISDDDDDENVMDGLNADGYDSCDEAPNGVGDLGNAQGNMNNLTLDDDERFADANE